MYRMYSVKEFVNALSSDTLKRPLLQRGIVKQDISSNNETLLFTQGECEGPWISIPIELIEQIMFITMLQCGNHEHPFVEMSLKRPSVENRQATAFSELFQNTQLGIRPISDCEAGCLKIKDTQARLNCMLKCIADGK